MVFSRRLTKKELNIIKKIVALVERHQRAEGHDYSHVLEVTRWSIKIAERIKENVNPFILICGAALHDIGRINNPYSPMHGLEGGAIAEEFLESFIDDRMVIDRIEKIIIRHSPTSMIPPKAVEEKIVFDADAIERLGFMGLIRGIMGKTGTIQYIVEDRINKRLKDYDKLFFEESKKLAQPYQEETEKVAKSLSKKLSKRVKEVDELISEKYIEKTFKKRFKKKK